MLELLKITALQHKLICMDAQVTSAGEVLEMATLGGARAMLMEKQIGSLEIGKKADMFVFNPLKCNSTPVHDPISAIVYSSSPSNIESTIVGGKIIMENGKIIGVDENDVLWQTQKIAASLVKRAGLGNIQWNQKVCSLY